MFTRNYIFYFSWFCILSQLLLYNWRLLFFLFVTHDTSKNTRKSKRKRILNIWGILSFYLFNWHVFINLFCVRIFFDFFSVLIDMHLVIFLFHFGNYNFYLLNKIKFVWLNFIRKKCLVFLFRFLVCRTLDYFLFFYRLFYFGCHSTEVLISVLWFSSELLFE